MGVKVLGSGFGVQGFGNRSTLIREVQAINFTVLAIYFLQIPSIKFIFVGLKPLSSTK
jgi:hypothetical protein